MLADASINPIAHTLLMAISLALACALLSVVVVLRRWAFIGEGISHSGFGGAGTAWLLMLGFPALNHPWIPYITVVLFCLITAVAIGGIIRGRGVNSDAAIGIFMVASLAWGFLAQQIYIKQRGMTPALFNDLLFGEFATVTPAFAQLAAVVCIVVVVVVVALWKEILVYCFDPLLASTSGVSDGFIHYLLMLLIALVIVLGVRVAGSVLVTALLVLPGATALVLSKRFNIVIGVSTLVAIVGTVGGILLAGRTAVAYLPPGPMIVLLMFAEFLLAYGVTAVIRRREM